MTTVDRPLSKPIAEPAVGEPLGEQTNAVRWLQKKVMEKAALLPQSFATRAEWERFRGKIRSQLPGVIGIPQFPALRASRSRGKFQFGPDAVCERIDVYVDEDYSVPCFVYSPLKPPRTPMPALLWNPGWGEDKWQPAYQRFAQRLVAKGWVMLVLDHAPFGETTPFENKCNRGMTHVMAMGHVIGVSQLALRSAETSRCGQYLRSRPDVDPKRVALAGLCQGGQDTWLTAAYDEGFCAAAPLCSASTMAVHMEEMGSYWANADASPFPFGILNLCDVEHLHACIAPRPMLIRINLPDQWWPVSGLAKIEAMSRQVYRLYDAQDRLDIRAETHEHNLTGPFADALEAFLLKVV